MPAPQSPASVRSPEDDRAWRVAVGVTVAAAVIRLCFAALVPLVPDETYYWEWSRRPAPSYFDHPPAVAAVISAGTALLGHTRLGVRLPTVLLGLLGSLATIAIARRLGNGSSALVAALALAVMPMAATGLLLTTPDAPLLAAFTVATWALVRAVEEEPGSLAEIGWWCAAGSALGAALLSKYTAVLLPAGAALGFALDPRLRHRLRSPGPWIGVGLGLAVFSPVIWWNAQLGWPSFAYQLGHGFGGSGASGGLVAHGLQSLNRELQYLGGQLGLVSPILFAIIAVATARALREGRRGAGDERRTVLAGIALVVFATFALSALRRRVEPNWPAPAYVAGVVLLGTAVLGPGGRRWLKGGLWLGAVLVTVVYAQAVAPVLPLDARDDPIARAHGWEALADTVDGARAELLGEGCPAAWVATNRYQYASQLAFHLPDQATVFSLNVRRRSNQYDFWPGFEDVASRHDCLVFVGVDEPESGRISGEIGTAFASVTEAGTVTRTRGRGVVERYRLWVFGDWNGGAIRARR